MSEEDYIELKVDNENSKNIEKVTLLISVLTNIFGIVMVGVGYNSEKNECSINFWYYLYMNVILNLILNFKSIVEVNDSKTLIGHAFYKFIFIIWGSILFSERCTYFNSPNLYIASLIYYVHDFFYFVILLLKFVFRDRETTPIPVLNKDIIFRTVKDENDVVTLEL